MTCEPPGVAALPLLKIQARPSPGSCLRTVLWRQKGFGSFLYEGSIWRSVHGRARRGKIPKGDLTKLRLVKLTAAPWSKERLLLVQLKVVCTGRPSDIRLCPEDRDRNFHRNIGLGLGFSWPCDHGAWLRWSPERYFQLW